MTRRTIDKRLEIFSPALAALAAAARNTGQSADALAARIASGSEVAHRRLPSMAELADRFGRSGLARRTRPAPDGGAP